MACRDPEPTARGLQTSYEAGILIYVYEKLNIPVPEYVKFEANLYNVYDGSGRSGKVVPALCKALTDLSEEQRDTLIYNARDAKARKLADWWEEHQRHDQAMHRQEEYERKQKELVDSAKSKLTDEELKALKEFLKK